MQFNLGTVVSLKSNGLLPLANHNFIKLGGNEKFTTPLMVVIEILHNTSTDYDDETGENKSSKKGNEKYKCIYFSNKSMKFEENWFSKNELKQYGEEDEIHNNINSNDLNWGDIVRFKTVDEEAKKTKSFNEGENNKNSKPLLNFTSPAMQIVGFATPDRKESLIDSYNGLKKRDVSKKIVKCKFFNVDSDKFSEQLIPIECLQKIIDENIDEKLNTISSSIKENCNVLIEFKNSKEISDENVYNIQNIKYFGSPKSISFISGRYQMEFYNELKKKNEFIWLDLIKDFHKIDLSESKYFPTINKDNSNLKSIFEFFDEQGNDLKGKHLKITYKNLKEQIVSRYITIIEISNQLDNNDTINSKYYYLKSFCHLRAAEREFRSDRMLSIRTIEDEKLNLFLTTINKKKMFF
jgi:hypothetical protein